MTNAIGHAQKLLKKGYEVLLIGGKLKGVTEAIVGAEALESLNRYNFTKGFFGTNGVDKKHGFTTPDPAEAMIKKAAMERCRTCYILADSSKIGQIAPVTFAKFDQAKLITTELTDKDLKKEKNIVEVKA